MDKKRGANLIEQMLALVNIQEDGSFVEAEVSDDTRKVKNFIDEMPGGFLIYQADDRERLIYANKKLLRIFKCKTFTELKELTGDSFKGIVHPEDLENVENSIKEQISSNNAEVDYVEYRIRAKDGTIRWVEDYGHFVKSNAIGNIFYVFITDATEKKNKLQQEHMQRLEVIEGLSVNYDSILHISLDKDTVLPYRLSSRLVKNFKELLHERQYSPFVKEYVKMWVHPEDKERVRKMLSPDYIRKALKEDKTYYLNFRCIQNRETQYLQARLANVTQGDSVSQVVIGYRNVDVEVLQEMKQKKLLEEALNTARLSEVAKSTFLSNMSHDLRTPLNAIFGYTALAKKNIKDESLTTTYLDKIEKAGRSILKLVDRVLELTYMESQDYKINEKKCNLHDLVQDVFRTAMPAASQKDISISLHSEALKHGDVYADKDKLKQVLDRIVDNAVTYNKSGGNINITIAEQSSASNKEFAIFRFIVQDTGIGISQEFMPKIFEPFERENNTTLSGVFGSGLGLPIAKHIIDRMDGDIEINSKQGEGSTFTVTVSLKLQNVEEDSAASEKKLLKLIDGKKILLVEDNEINLEIETEMLQDLGLIIEPAENGQIAVDKLAAAAPDEYLFVLMDIQMPVMDGRMAAENIRKLPSEAANIPIIALSANAFENDKRMSLEAGMEDHINKPLDIPVLLKSLAKILNK